MALDVRSDIVRHVGDDEELWVNAGFGVGLKLVRLDASKGTWVIENDSSRACGSRSIATTGPVDALHADGPLALPRVRLLLRGGSYIYEPANSVHTLDVPRTTRARPTCSSSSKVRS